MKYLGRLLLLWLYCCSYLDSNAQFSLPDAPSNIIKEDKQNSFSGSTLRDSSLIMIADIAVSGNKKTKQYIIEREIPFSQGDYLLLTELPKKLQLAKEQITNTSLFVEVQVYIASKQGELIFINVDVKERWYLFPLPYFKLVDRNFNQWWVENKRSFDRVNYGLKFMQNNVSGRNDKLNIWLISGYNRQFDFKYEQPNANKSLTSGFTLRFIYSRQHELNYGTQASKQVFYKQEDFVNRTIRAEASYLYRPAIRTRHSFKLAYVDETIVDTVYKLNPHYFPNHLQRIRYPELSYAVRYLNVDYAPYPSKGFMGDATITKKGFSKDINLWQLVAHGTYTMPVLKKTQLQFQGAGVLSLPFDQPFYTKRMFGYGDIFLRGLEYYVIDGVAGAVGRATLRNEVFSFSLKNPMKTESHSSLPFRFFLKAYGDVGYAYNKNPGTSLLNNRLLKTGGFGLDIVTIYDVVIKIDYSFNQLGNQGLFIHSRSDF
jgi:outer membrane protein assembly factor BamA